MTGEAGIIQTYFAPLAAGFAGAFGLRDDAAAITPPPGFDVIVSVDAIAAGVHFFADDDAADIGWKALAVNVSDLIAKGAVPHAYVMSVAFPHLPDAAWLASFARGLGEAQRAFGLELIGGDTDRRPGPLSVTITAFGFVPRGGMVRRGAARVGDHVFVSGRLGDSALGLALRAGTASFAVSDGHRAALIGRYLRPSPPMALVPVLRAYASASMDISDGLIKDLTRMCEASGVGARIELGALPLSDEARAVVAVDTGGLQIVATGGDDYQVLACVSPEVVAAFRAGAHEAGVIVTDVGLIVADSNVVVIGADGRPVEIQAAGYDHF